jgi:hypothetical protein
MATTRVFETSEAAEQASRAGLLALRILQPIERRYAGGPPVYEEGVMLERRIPGLNSLVAGFLSGAIRKRYALGLVKVLEGLEPLQSIPGGLLFGAAVATAERLILPAVGAAPPYRRWSKPERIFLLVHACAFGAVAGWRMARARRSAT